jgi:hypothetical protein
MVARTQGLRPTVSLIDIDNHNIFLRYSSHDISFRLLNLDAWHKEITIGWNRHWSRLMFVMSRAEEDYAVPSLLRDYMPTNVRFSSAVPYTRAFSYQKESAVVPDSGGLPAS